MKSQEARALEEDGRGTGSRAEVEENDEPGKASHTTSRRSQRFDPIVVPADRSPESPIWNTIKTEWPLTPTALVNLYGLPG